MRASKNGLLGRGGLLGALDQREHVAHSEDPGGHPVGVEDLEHVELLARRGEHDRLAGDALDRERRTAARVSVELGQDHAVEVDLLVERCRDIGGLLARHRVEHEQGVRGLDGITDAAELVHELGVDLEAAGGVDDHGIEPFGSGTLDAGAGRLDEVSLGAVDGDA